MIVFSRIHRGVVKWYHTGLQNPCCRFDSGRPCQALLWWKIPACLGQRYCYKAIPASLQTGDFLAMTAVEAPSMKIGGFSIVMCDILHYLIWPVGLAVTLFTIGFISVFVLAAVIELMYFNMHRKIANEAGQGRGKTLAIVQGKQKKIREKHMISIERMERIKKSLISILPFMKNI